MDGTFIDIVGHENVSSGSSNKYTIYYLEVSQDDMRWIVKHRYHDFKHLHDQVCLERQIIDAMILMRSLPAITRRTQMSTFTAQEIHRVL